MDLLYSMAYDAIVLEHTHIYICFYLQLNNNTKVGNLYISVNHKRTKINTSNPIFPIELNPNHCILSFISFNEFIYVKGPHNQERKYTKATNWEHSSLVQLYHKHDAINFYIKNIPYGTGPLEARSLFIIQLL